MLTQVAGSQVCPSDDVDQAWHLHITRTADYQRFCHEVFGRFVHHRPAASGDDEDERHRRMYAQTLSLYRRAFQAPAPDDIWPAVDRRFAPPRPAPDVIRLHGAFASAPLIALAGLIGAFVLATALGMSGVLGASHEVSGPRFLHFAVPVTLALVLLGWLSTSPFERGRTRDTLDVYEAAWLAGDGGRVAAAAIGLLVHRGHLRLRSADEGAGWRRRSTTRLVVADGTPRAGLHPVELACLAAARAGVLTFDQAHGALQAPAHQIGRRLRGAGLAADEAVIAPARAAVAIVTGAWLAVEIERLAHAVTTPRPLGFLIVLTMATAATFVLLMLRHGRANWRGDRALRSLGETLQGQSARNEVGVVFRRAKTEIPARLLPMTLALLGPAAVLAQPDFAGFDRAIGPEGMRQAGSGNSSGGDGGGGGGCGGGCGGGGCGG